MKKLCYQFYSTEHNTVITLKCSAEDLTISNGRVFLKNKCVAELNYMGYWVYNGKKYTDFGIAGG